jgi:hypothetical protein
MVKKLYTLWMLFLLFAVVLYAFTGIPLWGVNKSAGQEYCLLLVYIASLFSCVFVYIDVT